MLTVDLISYYSFSLHASISSHTHAETGTGIALSPYGITKNSFQTEKNVIL